jgi:hypothetical protein
MIIGRHDETLAFLANLRDAIVLLYCAVAFDAGKLKELGAARACFRKRLSDPLYHLHSRLDSTLRIIHALVRLHAGHPGT